MELSQSEPSQASKSREAYITMVTSTEYVIGALVMAHSLKTTGTTKPLLCMVTNALGQQDLDSLRAGGLLPLVVDLILAPCESGIREWADVGYTKLNLWSLTDWDKLVYIDADCLIVGPMDELFQRSEAN